MDTTNNRVNGFNPEDITATINALKENPALASFEWRAHNKWINGGHNRSTIQGFYGGGKEDTSREKPFIVDNAEPPILLGNNEGPNPVEFILHGLAGCMTTTMVLHAAAHRIPIDSVETKLTGDWDAQGFLGLDPTVRNGYKQIHIDFKIEGDLTDEQKEQLISFAKKSPVYDIVTHGVPVEVGMQEPEAVV
ncbi:OsmC family protein [Pontibacter anaerobius]|uniref:OsmC family protein n=1 Tax=Pontibacter anaerobius TaxID=2993940 RepID=A0ABT3RFX3_9BACT|nr:OsmC family protein [Pontibacter anaerobius]MCX2740732.1 OsmC family protein [Pontibacter anaerobius]